MRIVGITRNTEVIEVAELSKDGGQADVIAELGTFWAAPADHMAAPSRQVRVPAEAFGIVPPVLPGARVICVGLNYLKHLAEGSYRDQDVPEHPTLFGRWAHSLTVNGADVPVPSGEDGLDWEGEIVAWVGRTLVDATAEEAQSSVIGYSTFNDLTARRAQKASSQWTIGKNADKSGPLGPIVPAKEVGDLRSGLQIVTKVNGETVQDGNTADMVYTVGETLSYISQTMTIRPGDLLATGTPSGVGYARTPQWLLHPGDVVEVTVDKLGTLRNQIVHRQRR